MVFYALVHKAKYAAATVAPPFEIGEHKFKYDYSNNKIIMLLLHLLETEVKVRMDKSLIKVILFSSLHRPSAATRLNTLSWY
jgi:hypothetical protein